MTTTVSTWRSNNEFEVFRILGKIIYDIAFNSSFRRTALLLPSTTFCYLRCSFSSSPLHSSNMSWPSLPSLSLFLLSSGTFSYCPIHLSSVSCVLVTIAFSNLLLHQFWAFFHFLSIYYSFDWYGFWFTCFLLILPWSISYHERRDFYYYLLLYLSLYALHFPFCPFFECNSSYSTYCNEFSIINLTCSFWGLLLIRWGKTRSIVDNPWVISSSKHVLVTSNFKRFLPIVCLFLVLVSSFTTVAVSMCSVSFPLYLKPCPSSTYSQISHIPHRPSKSFVNVFPLFIRMYPIHNYSSWRV